MPQYFFDTSALVKYYHEETGSNRIKALFSSPHFSAKISALGVLEAQSAFAMKARSGKLALIGAELLKARFMLDVSAGLTDPSQLRRTILLKRAASLTDSVCHIGCGHWMLCNWLWPMTSDLKD